MHAVALQVVAERQGERLLFFKDKGEQFIVQSSATAIFVGRISLPLRQVGWSAAQPRHGVSAWSQRFGASGRCTPPQVGAYGFQRSQSNGLT
jgi:hypothetical protein